MEKKDKRKEALAQALKQNLRRREPIIKKVSEKEEKSQELNQNDAKEEVPFIKGSLL